MREIRLAVGILAIAAGRFSIAADAVPAPAPLPPQPAVQQSAAPDSPAQKLLREKLAQRDTLQREIEELSQATGTPQQILVRVQMMEVDLTHLRKLGMDFEGNDPLFKSSFQVYTSDSPTKEGNLELGAEPSAASSDQRMLRNFLDTLEQNGIAKTIADPMLVTVSGRPASFNVGGEFPVPAANGGPYPVEFRSYGTELNVIAVPLGNNKVRLEVHPRVTEMDAANSITIAGQKVPSVRVQQCDTSCEAAFGETVRLSGLATKRTVAIRNEKGTTNHIEHVGLWVFVTAELAEPMDPGASAFMQAPSAVYTPPTAPRDEARFGSRPATNR